MWQALIPVVANLAGGVLGDQAASGSQSASDRAARAAAEALSGVKLPSVEEMKIALENYQSTGVMTPELEQMIQLSEQDQLANITTDPRLRQAQMDALGYLQQTGEMGLTPAERAQARDLRRQTEADAQSRTQALLQQQDARGVGSTDMALAARMLEAQSSANRQASSMDELAGQAQQRALQAMTQYGSMAGQMEGAEYARQAALADALRQREMMNVQNQQQVQQRNVGSKNAAREFNLRNQQRLAEANVDLRNKQQMYNKELLQQDFENRIRKAGGVATANQNMADRYAADANRTRNQYATGARGIGEAGAGFVNAFANQPAKPPVEDEEQGYFRGGMGMK